MLQNYLVYIMFTLIHLQFCKRIFLMGDSDCSREPSALISSVGFAEKQALPSARSWHKRLLLASPADAWGAPAGGPGAAHRARRPRHPAEAAPRWPEGEQADSAPRQPSAQEEGPDAQPWLGPVPRITQNQPLALDPCVSVGFWGIQSRQGPEEPALWGSAQRPRLAREPATALRPASCTPARTLSPCPCVKSRHKNSRREGQDGASQEDTWLY